MKKFRGFEGLLKGAKLMGRRVLGDRCALFDHVAKTNKRTITLTHVSALARVLTRNY